MEIIIIMEICKAPTLRPKALNKHTHIMYTEMENVIIFFFFKALDDIPRKDERGPSSIIWNFF